jgi:hypothetical protein
MKSFVCKKQIVALLSGILSVLTNSCISQTPSWLETNKKEFENLFPLFDNLKTTGEVDAHLYESSNYQNIRADTLTPGVWSIRTGTVQDCGCEENFKVKITETFPFIKGISFSLTNGIPTIDGGQGSIDSVQIDWVGKNDRNKILLACKIPNKNPKFKDEIVFIEGQCFSFDVQRFKELAHLQVFIGKGQSSNENNFSSKGFIILKKDERR